MYIYNYIYNYIYIYYDRTCGAYEQTGWGCSYVSIVAIKSPTAPPNDLMSIFGYDLRQK